MKEKTNLSYSVRPLVSMRDLVQSSCRLYADRPAFLYWAAGGVVTVHYREVYEEILHLPPICMSRGFPASVSR